MNAPNSTPPQNQVRATHSLFEREQGLVLVCDDDQGVLQLLTTSLERAGYAVIASQNARNILNEAARRSLKPRLLVTDVVMPQLTGVALANTLREKHPNIGVLYVSGYSSNVLKADELARPRTALLLKPFHRADLLARVAALLESPEPNR